MRIIYIADDGTKFDDEYECKDYEWRLNHLHLKDIRIYDKEGNELRDIFSEDTYDAATRIVVPSGEAVKELQDLTSYTGYYCYGDINETGEWKFDDTKEAFVMFNN